MLFVNYQLGYFLRIAERQSQPVFRKRQPNASTAALVRAAIDPDGSKILLALSGSSSRYIATNPADQLVVTMLARAYVRNGQPEQDHPDVRRADRPYHNLRAHSRSTPVA